MLAQLDKKYICQSKTKTLVRLLSYSLFEGRPVTTRGQWINPLVFALFSLEKQLPQIKPVRKPIFILGTGRSGTTVLGIVMSMHRRVGYLNEPKALWHSIYSKEDVIGSYHKGDAKYRLAAEDADEFVIQRARRLFGFYLWLTCNDRVVDKYPELIFRMPFVRTIFPDAKFIFLVRDGRETIASIDKWSQQHGQVHKGEKHNWWGVDQRKWKMMLNQLVKTDPWFQDEIDTICKLESHTDMAAIEWIATMRQGLDLLHKYENCVLRVHYEDLVANPKMVLNNISTFCELEPDTRMMDYALAKLRPSQAHGKIDLHPAIQKKFQSTCCDLGY